MTIGQDLNMAAGGHVSEETGRTLADIGEFDLINRIRTITGSSKAIVGIGDDAAVIDQPGELYLLVTTDMQIQDVHFRLDEASPFEIGRKAIAVNASDIAAMAGDPTYALTSVAASATTDLKFLEELYRGIEYESSRLDVGVIGGNVSGTAGPLTIDVTMLGEVKKTSLVLRSGAQPGDVLAVTGTLGERATLRALFDAEEQHQSVESGLPSLKEFWKQNVVPEARVREGRMLGASGHVHAILDISDGLSSDAQQLAVASYVGVLVRAKDVPMSDQMRRIASQTNLDPLALALSGGEDYELLVALPEEWLAPLASLIEPVPLTEVGKVLPRERGCMIELSTGHIEALSSTGWTHF